MMNRVIGCAFPKALFSVGKNPVKPASTSVLQTQRAMPASGIHRIHVPLTFGGNGLRKVTIMSYNVENLTESAAWDPLKVARGKSYDGIKGLGEIIRTENPDILGVQEIQNANVLKRLNLQELNGNYNVICPFTSDSRGMTTGFLYKKDLDLVEWKTYSPKNQKNEPVFLRDLLEATFKFTTPDGCEEQIVVLNAHFKAMRGGEAKTTPRRVQEAKAASQIIADILRKNPKANVVLLGDLNFKAETDYGKQVMSALLSEKDSLNRPNIAEIFGNNPPPTHRFKNQTHKLDYMFVSQNLLKDKLESHVSGQFGTPPWSEASDHLPPVSVVKTRCQHGSWEKGNTPPAQKPRFSGQPEAKQLSYIA